MVKDKLISASSTTAIDKADMLQTYDGYKLKFSMIGMELAVDDHKDDTCAICLASKIGKGATCAGIYSDG